MARKTKLFLSFLISFLTILGSLLVLFLYAPDKLVTFSIKPSAEEELFSNKKEVYLNVEWLPLTLKLTNTQRHKGGLSWSPKKSKLAFYERVMEPAEKLYDREWALKIIDPRALEIKTVFIGNSKTSEYKWLDEKTIRIFMNGGTGVRIYRDIDITAGEPFVAAEHWSPEFWTPIKL